MLLTRSARTRAVRNLEVPQRYDQLEPVVDHPRLRPFPRRLSKYLVHSGYSGKQAKRLCQEKRVCINDEPGVAASIVQPLHDRVHVDGQLTVLQAPRVYVMLHKPFNVVSSLSFNSDAPSDALTLLHVTEVACWPAVGHVGRLDRDSVGALILTDDGDFSRLISLPGQCTKVCVSSLNASKGLITSSLIIKDPCQFQSTV